MVDQDLQLEEVLWTALPTYSQNLNLTLLLDVTPTEKLSPFFSFLPHPVPPLIADKSISNCF